jgi:hypothetical protein
MTWNWTVKDWADPDGGVLRLFPYIPAAVLPRELRPRDDWDGVAFLLHEEELDSWSDEERMEKSSKGSATALAIEGGGDLSRMLIRMQLVDGIQAPRFPDPEPHRLANVAEKGKIPAYFVEPGVDDEEWLKYLEDCADEASRLPRMAGMLFARGRYAKELKGVQQSISEPKGTKEPVDLAICAGVAAAWWRRSESLSTEELRERRNRRLCSRLRGALAHLRESDGEPVLIVPVIQDWLDDILATLKTNPDIEPNAPVGAELS